MTIPIIAELRGLAAQYDGFVIDLWGVLHDGTRPYPGAVSALTRLSDAGKAVVLLSNSPRRAASLVTLLTRMGIERRLYRAIVSSGEAVHAALLARSDPWFAALGKKCYHVGPERDRHLFDGLGLTLVNQPEAGVFLLNTGPDDVSETLALYQPMLDRSAALGLKMICANPDLVVMHEGQEMLCAGSLAAYYQTLGGEVCYRGKPDPAIYQNCFALLEIQDNWRILAIGDSFHTDMVGAARAGIDALLCCGGVHAEALGNPPDAGRLQRLAQSYPAADPIAAIPNFVW